MTTQTVLYARYSPRPGRKANDPEPAPGPRKLDVCESIETQLERLRAWAIATDRVILAEYDDPALSGSCADNRPGLQAAIAHACREKAVLAVYNLSRLARNTRDAIDLAERLTSAKADLASLHEAIDTTTPMGRFFFTIMAAVAQLEREQISERTSDAMLRHQQTGRRMGRADRIPWGMMLHPANKRVMVPCPEEMEISDLCAQKKREGCGLRAIARWLEEEGYLRRGSETWDHCAVTRALRELEARQAASLPNLALPAPGAIPSQSPPLFPAQSL